MAELPTGTVTFLFTDIEGSTRLLKRLGRDRYGTVLSRHNALLREAFSGAGGMEIETKGDSFFVVFPSAGAAVVAAAAAQKALADEDWSDDGQVRVRMGLHTGEAVFGPDGYVGFAVHQAARVGDVGHGGQILLSSTTASLVENDLPSEVGLRDLGENRLPDVDRPQRLFQLTVEGLPQEFAPVGRRVAPTPGSVGAVATPLLERDAEVATVSALVETARSGAGRMIAIEGRAGMGKSRLLTEARTAASEAGFQVLFARSAELEQDFAYCVVRQLFEPHLAHVGAAERADLLAGAAALTERLFDDAQLDTSAGAADVSFGILHGLYWLAANVAQRKPVLIAIDDLHWTDAPTLRWLTYLARRLEGLPILVAVALRPPEQSHEPELLAEIVADPSAVVLRPGALGVESVAALAGNVFRREPDAAFAEAVHASAGGNPLFVRALLDATASEGLTPTAENAARMHEIGPEAVSRAVLLRMARMPEEARRFARAAAVLGDGTELQHAAELAELDGEVAVHAHTTLARADLVRLKTPIEFSHPVVRAAVYETIDMPDRTAVHRRAAVLLAEKGAAPERVAAHLDLVPPNGDLFVVATLRQAAERSLASGAPDPAVRFLRRALEEPPAKEDRVDVLEQLGLAESRVDAAAAAEHLGAAIAGMDDPSRRALLSLYLARCLTSTDRQSEAVDVLQDALDRLDGDDQQLRKLLEADVIGSAWWDSTTIDIAYERVAKIRDEDLGDGLGGGVLRAVVAYWEVRRGLDRERSLRLAREAASNREVLESEASIVLYYIGYTLTICGEVDEAERFFEAALEPARRRGDVVTVAGLQMFRGYLWLKRGNLTNAEEYLRDVEALISLDRFQTARPYLVSYLADVLVEQGELEEAEALLATMPVPEEVPAIVHLFYYHLARARLRHDSGRREEALADLLALGKNIEVLSFSNPASLPWRSYAALTLVGLGRPEEGRPYAEAELEAARQWGTADAIGLALRALGRTVEDADESERLLRESADVLRDSHARLQYAWTLRDLGALLNRRDQHDEAREFLHEALDIATRTGAPPLADLIQSELSATGATPRTLVVTGVEALTASERRVAEMVAQGMTSTDVAQELFVTPKAIEGQLNSVYRKLGIGSLSELGGVLGEPAVA